MRIHPVLRLISTLALSGILAGETGGTGPQENPASPFPYDAARRHNRDFRPSGGMSRLSPNLFLFEDTCNVYLSSPLSWAPPWG